MDLLYTHRYVGIETVKDINQKVAELLGRMAEVPTGGDLVIQGPSGERFVEAFYSSTNQNSGDVAVLLKALREGKRFLVVVDSHATEEECRHGIVNTTISFQEIVER